MLWTWIALLLIAPALLITWLALDRYSELGPRMFLTIAAGGYLVAIAFAGLWLVVPRPVLWMLVAAYAAVAIRIWSRPPVRRPHPGRSRSDLFLAARGVAAMFMVVLAAAAFDGGRAPHGTVDLAFPLRSGTYLVVNGGRSDLVNAHLATLEDERYRAYRGQSFGIDVVEIGRFGTRAASLRPADPTRYRIFGDSLFAPCEGTVVAATDGHPDMPVPQRDRSEMAGNHVIIECSGVWVVLAHLQAGSVPVAPAQRIARGAYLGRVGNSGNTDEPHLHIHAQKPAATTTPLAGEPLPMRFEGRYLARNSRVVHRG